MVDYLRRPQMQSQCLYKRKAEGDLAHRRGGGNAATEAGGRDRSEGCSHKARNAGSHQKLEEAGQEAASPPELPWRGGPANTLILVQWKLISDFWPPELREYVFLSLNQCICGDLFQQLQETNPCRFQGHMPRELDLVGLLFDRQPEWFWYRPSVGHTASTAQAGDL